jgi:hypothetical protein
VRGGRSSISKSWSPLWTSSLFVTAWLFFSDTASR